MSFVQNKRDTSWNKSGKWYNKIVGESGHYYHEHVVFPGVLRLLDLKQDSKLLDIGCGQGILGKKIPAEVSYTGIDLAGSLIKYAKNADRNNKHAYHLADATKPYTFEDIDYTHAAAVLSLQNMENPGEALKQAGLHLMDKGRLVIVLNHPAFRIPRQSGWGTGENKLQYRYVNRYLSPLKIPILMHPGEKKSEMTWSFHYPISFYASCLKEAGFMIETMEEWASDKISVGKAAKMENRARSEIPLFLTIAAVKTAIR